ncbi:MAG: DUF547 domain-containing protein [Acidobacteria bacterium]|nr:MAG: DUF547 domain-containing protein [Acidobacteriota bacterium]MCE7958601.1 DUF547 domain-containing protein [Acidobacteria bacterium ACB2]
MAAAGPAAMPERPPAETDVTPRPTRLAMLPLLVLSALPLGAAERFSHADWGKVLARFVEARGRVDYEGLAGDRADLDRYLAAVRAVSPRNRPDLFPGREERLAYYLNAYNALVFEGVLARGPERESVWTGGLVSGYGFFVRRKVVLGGEETSLKKLEDDWVREGFADPRVHAALNCASLGCPRLPREPFEGEGLDARLDAAMTEFVGEARNVSVDGEARTVTLSRIFDWFEEDFLSFERARGSRDPRLADYVNRYRGALPRVPRDYRVRFFPYDKRLNGL